MFELANIFNLFKSFLKDLSDAGTFQNIEEHPAFEKIIEYGNTKFKPIVLAFIIDRLEHTDQEIWWLKILRKIVKDNPVKPEHRQHISMMIKDWIEWYYANYGIRTN